MWVLAILSMVTFALLSATQVEARVAADAWNELRLEQLAHSGQEMEKYLRSRGFGFPTEDLAGAPVSTIVKGFRYGVSFPEGDVDIYLEGEGGRISLTSADSDLLKGFFDAWVEDPAERERVVRAIEDWRDPDPETRPNGAESAAYAASGYQPRNGLTGLMDLPLIRGLNTSDFQPGFRRHLDGTVSIRESLAEFVTALPTGGLINPNFAPERVLRAIPELSEPAVQSILAARSQGVFFRDQGELRARAVMSEGAAAWRYLTFDRGLAPAVLTVARQSVDGGRASERRSYAILVGQNPISGFVESQLVSHQVELNRFPDFLLP